MDNYTSYKIKNISFILTIIVVILHAYNLPNDSTTNIMYFIQNYISHGIATVAVPIFFIISGFLFFYNFKPSLNNWIKKYKSRFKSLFIPYMIWCTLWMVVLYLIQMTPYGKSLFSNMILNEFSNREVIQYTYINPIPFQLWYVADLINKKIGSISGPILIILWFLGITEFPIAMFSFGAYIAINNVNLDLKEKKYICIIATLMFFSLNLVKTYFLGTQLHYLAILSRLVIILGIISIWTLYDQYSDKLNKVFNITKYSFFVYLCHEPLQSSIIRLLLKLLLSLSTRYMIVYFISPILTTLICLGIAIFLDKNMNKIYKVLTGWR